MPSAKWSEVNFGIRPCKNHGLPFNMLRCPTIVGHLPREAHERQACKSLSGDGALDWLSVISGVVK